MSINNFSFFNQSCQAFNENQYEKAIDLLEQFKKGNQLINLSTQSFYLGYFEVLLNFKIGQSSNQNKNLEVSTSLAKKILKNTSLDADEKAQLWGIVGECYSILKQDDSALSAFYNVVENDHQKIHKPFWFKFFVLISKKNTTIAKDISSIILEWSEFEIPTRFTLIDIAKHELDKTSALVQINALNLVFFSLDLQQKLRLISNTLAISEYTLAENLIEKSHEIHGNLNELTLYTARINFHKKNYAQVIDALEQTFFENDITKQLSANHIHAQAYEKLKNYDRAFTIFKKSSLLQEKNYKKIMIDESFTSRNYSNEYNDIDLDSINKKHFENAKNIAYKNQQKSPVFLLSFPRSGTTLLENILDTQPDIITLSERSTIADTLEYLVTKLRKNYPQDLLSLSKSEIKKLQKVYYETANIFCESDDLLSPKSQQILIDKMPLNTLHIPLIITMFPDAKFIFPLRHPVDCVLSCFQQNFVFNSEMHFLSTLENVTKKYIDVMQHFKRCQKALTLDIHFIKYEQLTTNIERECHKIFDFLGMDNIDKNFLAFDLHAKNKIISTASVNQVNQKLYQSSVYKWKNYEKHLTKQMEELKPFIEQFGYRKLEEDLKN